MRFLITFLLLFIAQTATSQTAFTNISYTNQNASPIRIYHVGDKLLRVDGFDIFGSALYVESYDPSDLKLLSSNKVKLKYNNRKLRKREVIYFGDELMFVGSSLVKSTNKEDYYLFKYLGGKELSEPIHLGTVNCQTNKKEDSDKQNQGIERLKVAMSEDGNKLALILPTFLNKDNSSPNEWEISLLDKGMKLNKNGKFKLETSNLFIDKMVLDNAGIVYCSALNAKSVYSRVCSNYTLSNFIVDDYTGSDLFLLKFDLFNHTSSNTHFTLGDENSDSTQNVNISSCSMSLIDNNIYFYGVLGELERKINGHFIVKLDKNGDVIFKKVTSNVSGNSFKGHTKRKEIKKNKVKKSLLSNLVQLDDSSLVFGLEDFFYFDKSYSITHSSFDIHEPTRVSSHAVLLYTFGSVNLYGFSPNGDYTWTQSVRKNQLSTNDEGVFSSCFMFNKKNKIHLVFTDVKMKPKTKALSLYDYEYNLISVNINADGEMTQKTIEKENIDGGFERLRVLSGIVLDDSIYMFGYALKKQLISSAEYSLYRLKLDRVFDGFNAP